MGFDVCIHERLQERGKNSRFCPLFGHLPECLTPKRLCLCQILLKTVKIQFMYIFFEHSLAWFGFGMKELSLIQKPVIFVLFSWISGTYAHRFDYTVHIRYWNHVWLIFKHRGGLVDVQKAFICVNPTPFVHSTGGFLKCMLVGQQACNFISAREPPLMKWCVYIGFVLLTSVHP